MSSAFPFSGYGRNIYSTTIFKDMSPTSQLTALPMLHPTLYELPPRKGADGAIHGLVVPLDTPPPSPTDADAVLPREGTAGEGGWIRGDDSLPQLEQQNPTTSPTGPSRTQDKSSLGLELITTQEKELFCSASRNTSVEYETQGAAERDDVQMMDVDKSAVNANASDKAAPATNVFSMDEQMALDALLGLSTAAVAMPALNALLLQTVSRASVDAPTAASAATTHMDVDRPAPRSLSLAQPSKRKAYFTSLSTSKTRHISSKKPKPLTPLSATALTNGPRLFNPLHPNRPLLFPGERNLLSTWSDDPNIPNVILQEPMEAEMAWDAEEERRKRSGEPEVKGLLGLPRRETKAERKMRVRGERKMEKVEGKKGRKVGRK